MPLLCNSPSSLDAYFARFAPAALKSFRHPGGWGVPIFDRDSEGRYQNFTGTLRGGYAFFTGTFPEKYHPHGEGRFSGQQVRIARKGHPGQGGGELRERDILLRSVSFFVCVKSGYHPPWSLRKILVPPLGNLVRNGYSP